MHERRPAVQPNVPLVSEKRGPYESEDEAGEHVGILRDPEMLKRLRHGQQISIGQHRLEDPSAFAERVEELLGG
jgi:hypothetical protein